MNKQNPGIGWCDYTWNPITGCLNHEDGLCKGGGFPCYAYNLAIGRLFRRYCANNNVAPVYSDGKGIATDFVHTLHPFYPRFWEDRIEEPLYTWDYTSKPCKIFVCDMADLFGIGILDEWISRVFETINKSPQNTFQLLTKQPQNLAKWSPFPDNCSVGVTACNSGMMDNAMLALHDLQAKVRFISIEPFLQQIAIPYYGFRVDWLIIGTCTGTQKQMYELWRRYPELRGMPYGNRWTAQPKIEWVQEIVEAADKAGVPIFLKENLKPLLESDNRTFMNRLYWKDGYYTSPEHPNIDFSLRQDFPKR